MPTDDFTQCDSTNTNSSWISFHDFGGLEDNRSWGSLNINEVGLFPRTPFLAN